LSEVAQILKSNLISKCGGVFRYGGDEFLVALIGCSQEDAERKLEKTRRDIEALNQRLKKTGAGTQAPISCSIGAVTVKPQSGQPFEDLFDIADRALYISKDQGRNCVTILNSN
jgi:diguanylate cyclase (GGDEF)-like protein